MNAAVKEQWLEALRSGRFKQAEGALRTADGYCCMGVLCELFRLAHPDRAKWGGDLDFTADGVSMESFQIDRTPDLPAYLDHRGEEASADLPEAVQKWAGFDTLDHDPQDPFVNGRQLSTWNDEEKLSFEEIADLIEAHL